MSKKINKKKIKMNYNKNILLKTNLQKSNFSSKDSSNKEYIELLPKLRKNIEINKDRQEIFENRLNHIKIYNNNLSENTYYISNKEAKLNRINNTDDLNTKILIKKRFFVETKSHSKTKYTLINNKNNYTNNLNYLNNIPNNYTNELMIKSPVSVLSQSELKLLLNHVQQIKLLKKNIQDSKINIDKVWSLDKIHFLNLIKLVSLNDVSSLLLLNKQKDEALHNKNSSSIVIVPKINEYKKIISKLDGVENLKEFMSLLFKFNANLAKFKSIIYNYYNYNNKLNFNYAYHILKTVFLSMGCLISKPIFKLIYTQNKIEDSENYNLIPCKKLSITLFYFVRANFNSKSNDNLNAFYFRQRQNDNLIHLFNNKFKYLADILGLIFGADIELNIIKLNRSYYESNILVQNLALNSYRYRFAVLMSNLFSKVSLANPFKINYLSEMSTYLFPSLISGIKVRLGGRTFKQRVVPRKTVQRMQRGSLNRRTIKFTEKASFTGKTRRGSYNFTVTLGHTF
jgi:hypothetical protein